MYDEIVNQKVKETNKANREFIEKIVIKKMSGHALTKTEYKEWSDLVIRIENCIIDNALENETVETTIKRISEGDEHIIDKFAKKASRQNIPEKVFETYVPSRLSVGFKINKLPSTGPNMRIIDSDGNLSNKRKSGKKDIDYHIVCPNGVEVFTTNKRARVGGGHQENQVNDARTHLENGNKYVQNNNNSVYFIAVMDGEYLRSRISDMNRPFVSNDRIKAMTTDDLIKFLEENGTK